MSKNVLIITTSLRANSNSEGLALQFAEGAKSSGNEVEVLRLADNTIHFCQGCLACQSLGHCIIPDDAVAIADKMLHADVLVFATPIYYYEMSGQMKTMLDRANPLYALDYQFRDVYLLCSAAEDSDDAWSRAANGLEGWIACFEKAHLAGVVFAGGVTDPGEVNGHPAMKTAYETGAQIV